MYKESVVNKKSLTHTHTHLKIYKSCWKYYANLSIFFDAEYFMLFNLEMFYSLMSKKSVLR